MPKNEPNILWNKFYYFKLGNACKDVFKRTYRGATCVLYDDENCDGREGVKEMTQGEFLLSSLEFDVESVSIRKGCFLNMYTGAF